MNRLISLELDFKLSACYLNPCESLNWNLTFTVLLYCTRDLPNSSLTYIYGGGY